MPQQAVFFDERTDAKRVRVLKVYDAAYARSCFDEMNEESLRFLANALDLHSKYEMADSASHINWEDVEEDAREEGNRLSFFVVIEEKNGQESPVYVSPDWPSAERFARTRV